MSRSLFLVVASVIVIFAGSVINATDWSNNCCGLSAACVQSTCTASGDEFYEITFDKDYSGCLSYSTPAKFCGKGADQTCGWEQYYTDPACSITTGNPIAVTAPGCTGTSDGCGTII